MTAGVSGLPAVLTLVLVLLLAPSPAVAQDDFFDGLEQTERPAFRLPGAQVLTLTKDDRELLRLLVSACRENLEMLRDGSKDNAGHSFLEQGYRPYETRKDERGRLMIVGTLFHNSFKGFSSEKNPVHDFRFDSALALSMQKPLPYLKALGAHASANGAKFLAAYESALRDLAREYVTWPESKWAEIPPLGVRLIAISYGRFLTLAHLAELCRESGRAPAARRDAVVRIDRVHDFFVTALGLSETGDSVDAQRAASAFARVSKGTGFISSHLPGVKAKNSGYALKPELSRNLERLIAVDAANSDVAAILIGNLVKPLTEKLWISPSINQSSRLTQEAAMLVRRVSDNLEGLRRVLQAF